VAGLGSDPLEKLTALPKSLAGFRGRGSEGREERLEEISHDSDESQRLWLWACDRRKDGQLDGSSLQLCVMTSTLLCP